MNPLPLPELKEAMDISARTVFGMESSQMSFLFFLVYAATAGGLQPLLESSSGSAQELKIKVSNVFHPSAFYWLHCSKTKTQSQSSTNSVHLSNYL